MALGYAGRRFQAWKQVACMRRIASRPRPPERPSRVLEHPAGLVRRGSVVGFAVPYLGSSVLELHHDLYLALYFASVLALCAAYVRTPTSTSGRR